MRPVQFLVRRNSWWAHLQTWLGWIGITIFGFGAVLDLSYHEVVLGRLTILGELAGPDGYAAHLVTIVGMTLIICALIMQALRKRG